jgi:hypothetical protein
MQRLHGAALVLLLVACATPPPAPAPVPVAAPAPVAAAPAVIEAPPPAVIKSQPLKHLPGRNLKAMPDKALEVRTKCTFRDVAGGRGSMDLQVSKAEVKRFVAEVMIPKQGLCRFELKNFRQTASLPTVVLSDEASGCVVRIWQQERGVTVAFNACQAQCAGDAFSYLWPILVDTRTGRCS